MIRILLSLLACDANKAPEILSINWIEPYVSGQGGFLEADDGKPTAFHLYGEPGFVPGGTGEIALQVRDPDDDAVQIVFSGTPGRLDFDPDRLVGTITFFDTVVIGEKTGWYVSVLDDGEPQLASEYLLYFDQGKDELIDSGLSSP